MNAVSATAARSASQAVPAAMPSHENAQASAPAQGNKVSGKAQSAPASKAAEPAASEESAEPYWRKSVQKALKEAADSAAARNTTASLEELAVAYEKARDASKKAHAAEQEDKSKFSAGNIASDAGHPGEQPAADGRQNSVRQGSAQGAQQRAVQTASAQVSSAKAVPADSASASKPQAVCSTAAAASGSSSAGGTVNTAAGNNNAAAGYASAQQQQTASSEPQNPDYDEEEEKRQMDRIMSMALATARGQAGKAKSAGVSSQKAQLVAAPLPRNWQEEQALFDYPECDYSEADKLDKKTGQLPILPEHIVWELRDIRAQLKTCGFRFGDLSRLIYAFYQYKSNWVMNTEQGPVRVTKENLKIACKQWVRNAERCYAAARAAGETPDAVTGQW